MGLFSTQNPAAFAFGLLGNITSFVVFLAPIPIFLRIFRKKSTEGFQSYPYLVSLFSAMIMLYYATLKPDGFLLLTINSFGCFIETIYIILFITYAPKKARRSTLRILLLLDFGGFCIILLFCRFLAKGPARIQLLGWVNLIFSACVFAAPLSIMRVVIRTKSVEFLPFHLSLFLTLSAIMWLFYGMLIKDYYVAVPNILGFVCGTVQMILYVIYRNYKTKTLSKDPELPQQQAIDDIKLNSITCETQEAVSPDKAQEQVQAQAPEKTQGLDHHPNENSGNEQKTATHL